MVSNGRPLCGTGVEDSSPHGWLCNPRGLVGGIPHVVRGLDTHSFRHLPTGQASGGQRRCPLASPTRVALDPARREAEGRERDLGVGRRCQRRSGSSRFRLSSSTFSLPVYIPSASTLSPLTLRPGRGSVSASPAASPGESPASAPVAARFPPHWPNDSSSSTGSVSARYVSYNSADSSPTSSVARSRHHERNPSRQSVTTDASASRCGGSGGGNDSTPMVSIRVTIAACSTAFRSSRTLPYHSRRLSSSIAAGESLGLRRRDATDEVLRQQRNVVRPLPQRGQLDLKHPQPEVKVLAELPLVTRSSSGRLVAATTRKSAVCGIPVPTGVTSRRLDRPQKLHLLRQRNVPDFIEEHRPPSARSRTPVRSRSAPVNAPLGVPKELALENGLVVGGHADRDKRPVPPLAAAVDRLGHQLLAGPARRRSGPARRCRPPSAICLKTCCMTCERPISVSGGGMSCGSTTRPAAETLSKARLTTRIACSRSNGFGDNRTPLTRPPAPQRRSCRRR